ncbi:MAG: DUF805 domain-containing protein [Salinispira sp.]
MLKKYATFAGRARRKEFWSFFIIHTLFSIILFAIPLGYIVSALFQGNAIPPIALVLAVLSIIYSAATIVPALAVTVRRLHDTGKSGIWAFSPGITIQIAGTIAFGFAILVFVSSTGLEDIVSLVWSGAIFSRLNIVNVLVFVPLLINSIALFIFYVQDSQPAENTYGPNPKEGNETLTISAST